MKLIQASVEFFHKFSFIFFCESFHFYLNSSLYPKFCTFYLLPNTWIASILFFSITHKKGKKFKKFKSPSAQKRKTSLNILQFTKQRRRSRRKYSKKECQVCFTHPKIHQLCKNFHSHLSIKRSLFNSIQPVFIHSVQLIERMNRILYAHTYKCRYKILKSLSYS